MFVWGNAKDEKLTALVIVDEMGNERRGVWLLSTLPRFIIFLFINMIYGCLMRLSDVEHNILVLPNIAVHSLNK